MTKLKNTNAHAVRFTLKVGRQVQVFNVAAGGEVEVPGDGVGFPKGLVRVAAKKAVKKTEPKKSESKKSEPKKETKTGK